MILLIDVGNSNTVFAYSDKEKVINEFRIKTFLDKTCDEYYLMTKDYLSNPFDDVIISSVVPLITSSLYNLFKKYYHIESKILAPGLKTGLQLKVDDPKQVGADIICDAVGAMKYHNESIVIDLGTATKYLYVSNNTFYGVAIAPGIALSTKALADKAALLTDVELARPNKVLGTNTISAMQSGILFGNACAIDGMIKKIKAEVKKPDLKVILTGGLSSIIAPLLDEENVVNRDLTLEGLLEIYKRNIK